jgi:hypothetical protein
MRTYTPSETLSSTYSLAEDAVDDDNAAAFNSPIEALADGMAYLDARHVRQYTSTYDEGTYASPLYNTNLETTYSSGTISSLNVGDIVIVSTEIEADWGADISGWATVDNNPLTITITESGTPDPRVVSLTRTEGLFHISAKHSHTVTAASSVTYSVKFISDNAVYPIVVYKHRTEVLVIRPRA